MDVVQRYTFADKTFGNFVAGKETDGVIPVSTTTSVRHSFSFHWILISKCNSHLLQDNRVSVKYELATEIVEKTDYTLSPNSAKFDLEINNFDYKGTASKYVAFLCPSSSSVPPSIMSINLPPPPLLFHFILPGSPLATSLTLARLFVSAPPPPSRTRVSWPARRKPRSRPTECSSPTRRRWEEIKKTEGV